MRRMLAATLLLACTLLVPSTSFGQSKEVVDLNAQIIAPTVQVVAGPGEGSGTVIFSHALKRSPDGVSTLVLTNFHVISGSIEIDAQSGSIKQMDKIKVRSFNYVDTSEFVSATETDAIVIAADKDRDLAVLQLVERRLTLPVARMPAPGSRLDQGEEVIACGAALGNTPFLSPTGRMGPFSQVFSDGQYFTLATTSIAFGNSGGGLYRKASDGVWEFVGVPSEIPVAKGPVWHMGMIITFPSVYAFLAANHMEFVFDKAARDAIVAVADSNKGTVMK
ncbi:serine protease [Mesorhizobium sp. ESP-6-4]|uniref:S1 family peptidase n=1 Tax=Mesorhizobium sp. ESP-6-4 TaxID=2876624 RepID=UPI001CC9FDF8|nr:serine protease [Mesorhizobium sp. ESP-6-4]MBZ9659755.1 serine protease [Mesorhizobium sp. ESP-6-4]